MIACPSCIMQLILARRQNYSEFPLFYLQSLKIPLAEHLAPEITSVFPNQKIIDRTSINAWVDANFRKAIEATKRKKIVVAGLWTEACVLFPTLEMLKAGYEVYVSTDACGDVSEEAHERSIQRLIQAGAVPITSLAISF